MKLRKVPLLICCLILLASSLTVNAAEIAQEKRNNQTNVPEKISTYEGEFAPGYYKVTGTGVRFRSQPGLSGNIIATLSKGEYIYYERAAGPTQEKDGYVWLHCERYATGEIGYMAINYLTPVDAPPGAPRRMVNWNK